MINSEAKPTLLQLLYAKENIPQLRKLLKKIIKPVSSIQMRQDLLSKSLESLVTKVRALQDVNPLV